MICEKCGREIQDNQTVCPYCSVQESVADAFQTTMTTIEEPVFNQNQKSSSKKIIKKRSAVQLTFGIIFLVLMAAVLVVSFLPSVLINGSWKLNQS